MANQNHGGGQPHPSASFQFQQQPQNVHGGGYDPHRFPRQLPTLGQYFPRFYHPDDQRRQPSQQHYPQQPTYIHHDPTQERQVYPTVFNPAMAQPPQPLLHNQPPPPLPGIEQQGPLVHDPQQPIYGYVDRQGNFYPDPTGTFFFAMAQSPQQQQLTVYPQLLPPQDSTPGIEQHEPLVQDQQPPILSPSTSTMTTTIVPAASMYDSIIVSPRDFFDSQDVKDAINILRMNLDIIYELRRKYHGNVSIDSTYPINALSEKSELTLAHVTVNILEAVLREAKCPGATFSRIPLKKLLEDYGIPESHRSFVEKFLMERDMKYWSYLVFMSIYFDLSPLPPKL